MALIHDWLTGMRGGEAVFQAIAELYPDAEIFTLVHDKKLIDPFFRKFKIHTSSLNRLPGIERSYRKFLPLMPWAIEQFDVRSYDLIISSSHCVAKGVRKSPEAIHVSYVHAPMRYMWDRFDEYFGPGKSGALTRAAAHTIRPWMKKWDASVSSCERIDRLIANSHFIASKIKEHYDRESTVIHPFVDFDRFQKKSRQAGDFYLMVGALAPYKRVDLAIDAFKKTPQRKLVIVGDGQDADLMVGLPSNVKWLGRQPNEKIEELFSQARAFLFPGEEDFGITPLEAMASGTPVIALGKGGALETVDSNSGIFFPESTVDSLMQGIDTFEKMEKSFQSDKIKERAKKFSKQKFQEQFQMQVNECLKSKTRRS